MPPLFSGIFSIQFRKKKSVLFKYFKKSNIPYRDGFSLLITSKYRLNEFTRSSIYGLLNPIFSALEEIGYM